MIHSVKSIIGGLPGFEKTIDEILAEIRVSLEACKRGGAFKYERLSAAKYVTDRQRKWYKGICIRGLSDWNGNTELWWDELIKDKCRGKDLLKIEHKGTKFERLTTKDVGVGNMTVFIQEILDKAIDMNWPVTPPDPELRGKKKNKT